MNNYPIKLINKQITERITYLNNNKDRKLSYNQKPDSNNKYITIPYFGQISQKIKNILNSYNIKTSFRNNCSFKHFIKLGKDVLNNCDQSNLVYKINCEICGKSYVGQTRRLLKTRCNEHKNNIKLNSKYHNVITKHIVENRDHNFNWNKTQIIHKENNLSKRLIAEMIYI